MARDRFRSPEPEWDRLSEWLRPGDTALDILRPGDTALDVGANVGHYTCRMSRLVGPAGRVVAFEPVPATFAALAANGKHFPFSNVTLVNAAVGDTVGVVGMSVPTGAEGSYLARVDPDAGLKCLVLSVDSLDLPGPVRLVKVDAEGYEPKVLAGMRNVLMRDKPVVILERNAEAEQMLAAMGYTLTRSPGKTPNVVAVM
ncbi:MAG: FkbM family methyltransferase [Fimbriiglobus sp.]|nr:FkbM family methyltransferase [Fimbriiglobus sp.]